MIRSLAPGLFAKQQVAEVGSVLPVHLVERFDKFYVIDTVADFLTADVKLTGIVDHTFFLPVGEHIRGTFANEDTGIEWQ